MLLPPSSWSVLIFLPISLFLSLLTLRYHPVFLPSPPPSVCHFPCFPDSPLFRLAAAKAADPAQPPKLAFLFLTTTPLPFAPLWHRFFSSSPNATRLSNIYIHADPSYPYDPPFTGLFAGKLIPSAPTTRSHPSLVAAARRLLAHALLHDPANAMFALLSPSCVPLRPFPSLYRRLIAGAPRKSFVEILSSEPSLPDRYAARGPGSMLPDVPFDRFRVGSQFFVLTRKHARLVVNDTLLWAHFRRPCSSPDTCYPEEHYFPTMLSMADPDGCVSATLTHVDWTGSVDGHPRTYQRHEVQPELIRTLRSARPRYGEPADNRSRSDPFLFARKFSPDCLEPLMNMADELLFVH